MKKTVIAATIITTTLFCTNVFAKDGTIRFVGDIVDSPCVVNPESQDQLVRLGQVKRASLLKDTVSTPVPFQIILEECDITADAGLSVEVGFTGEGAEEAPELITLSGAGSAKKVGIQLLDETGSAIALNTETFTKENLVANQNILNFAAQYKKIGENVEIGHASGTADFNLTYK
ncbi:fimbrial protein [Moellerella wisconsensis]|uniref:Fimbrial protein n=2 Tax=Moellerella wisconsensis TaxID=158849 RepID=A0ACD3Y7R2_9GAMM|nr:fimbrial protein [Moellerella wisconsensis]KLN95566.1 hypothetical protein VK86_14630 [Moellerella wisconsensis]UNH30880.1 fimbrial protein [Moellerella wisconsensis]UNH39025.1 fimbrial protein [Moellerella wisconsensis]